MHGRAIRATLRSPRGFDLMGVVIWQFAESRMKKPSNPSTGARLFRVPLTLREPERTVSLYDRGSPRQWAWYDAEKLGASRLAVGNAIRMMCRAPKSRAGCHFAAAIGLRSQLEGYVPTIPDFALDQHTLEGRKMGRGLDHFRSEGAKLVPPPTEPDPFENEAYRLWAIKQQGK